MLTSVPPCSARSGNTRSSMPYTDGGRGVLVWASKWRKGHAAHMAEWRP
jgi:hypothetical protein